MPEKSEGAVNVQAIIRFPKPVLHNDFIRGEGKLSYRRWGHKSGRNPARPFLCCCPLRAFVRNDLLTIQCRISRETNNRALSSQSTHSAPEKKRGDF
ncbi:hypothetical protein CDAR_567491 [Caerostris darwini]|uniref:Uncharacterized protein n=1 Tax=Caerostris darwini TaxID=1538125 RepID=A0AAV4QZU6_9ARAC|nr:hypothetical protein CDAR_567491 [Caerostris darwini]